MKPTITDIMESQAKLSTMRWNYWKDQIVFSFSWWFLLLSFLLLIIVWLRLLDRNRLVLILLFGFITLTIVTTLDTLGGELQLWEYPRMILPWGPRILCIDIMISIFFMLMFQFFTHWKSFIISSIVLSTIFSFVFEPIAEYLGIYLPIKWSHFYSFPIYIFLAVVIKLFVERIAKLNN